MNILIISRELPPIGGGGGNTALNIAKRLVQNNQRILIISMGFSGLPIVEEKQGLLIHRIPCGRKRAHSSDTIEMFRFVIGAVRLGRKLLVAHEVDLIHAHSIVPDGLIAYILGQRTRLPFVVTAHGSDVPGYNPDSFKLLHLIIAPVWNKLVDRAAAVTAPSQYLKRLINTRRRQKPIAVVPNGIDASVLVPARKERSFLIISRLVRRKNYHVFLEALNQIQEPQVVHIVGDGPLLPEMKRLAAAGPQHSVRFHGWLQHGSATWKALYEQSQFFVFPSSNENFPISLLEAQLAGMIVLASDIPGNREALGANALYYESLDATGVFKTITTALTLAPAELESMATIARGRVLQEFSWDALAHIYLEVLKNALVNERSSASP